MNESRLSDLQLSRVEALRSARAVLAASSIVKTEAVDTIDLVSVARFILDGEDPWECQTNTPG